VLKFREIAYARAPKNSTARNFRATGGYGYKTIIIAESARSQRNTRVRIAERTIRLVNHGETCCLPTGLFISPLAVSSRRIRSGRYRGTSMRFTSLQFAGSQRRRPKVRDERRVLHYTCITLHFRRAAGRINALNRRDGAPQKLTTPARGREGSSGVIKRSCRENGSSQSPASPAKGRLALSLSLFLSSLLARDPANGPATVNFYALYARILAKGYYTLGAPLLPPAEMGESLPRVSWISKHEPVSEVLKGAELTPGRMKRTTALLSSFVIRDRNRYCTCSTAAQTWMGLPPDA